MATCSATRSATRFEQSKKTFRPIEGVLEEISVAGQLHIQDLIFSSKLEETIFTKLMGITGII